jgi:lipoate-protein ligase A
MDLTYSFVGRISAADTAGDDTNPNRGFLESSIDRAYKQISQGLIEGLRMLGVEANFGQSNRGYKHLHDCFLSATGADLQVNGYKLIGSAQLRRQEGVLQHGSLLLDQEQSLMPQLLGLGAPKQENEHTKGPAFRRHTNLFDLIGPREIVEIERSLTKGFEICFGQAFEPGPITAFELSLARQNKHRFEIGQLSEPQNSGQKVNYAKDYLS